MMMKTYVIALLITLFFQSAGAQIASEEIASLKKQAEAGDPKAQVRLGTAYASGDGVAPDGTEAVKWFRKAAEQENAAGEYSLSEMYLTGRGVTVDVPEGLKFLRRSAEHGDP